MSDPLAEIVAMSRQVAALPRQISYIVLDHDCHVGVWAEDEDGDGCLYLRSSPSVLDSMQHRRGSPSLAGIPVYRRESLYEGWPGKRTGQVGS